MKLDKNDINTTAIKHIQEWVTQYQSFSSTNQRKKFLLETPLKTEYKKYLSDLYWKKYYGIKILAREVCNVSYPIMRLLLTKLNINYRTGQSLGNNPRLNKYRSIAAQGKESNFYRWPEKRPHLVKSHIRGISGYYNKLDDTKVWLRSTWEYIFAKWLDKNTIEWEYENKTFELSDGTTYRPDFYLISDNAYVEIKSLYHTNSREYKVEMVKKEYPKEKFILITTIKYFTKNYHKDLKEWKKYGKVD